VTVKYDPYPTVTVDQTVVLSDKTLSSIQINYGRRDVLEQPSAAFANMRFWTDGDSPLDIELSDSVEIEIAKGTTGTQTIFTGTISDIQISFDAYGADGSIAIYSVTAVGPLALLNKRDAGLVNYAKEFDGTRVYNILYDAFITTWQELQGTTSWTNAPNTISWTDYDATSQALVDGLAANVDVPGQYELQAYNDGATNAWTLAQDAANSGRGVLWEDGLGAIHYSDFATRVTAPVVTLTADDLLAAGLSVDAQWGEIYNYIEVGYRAGTVYAEDATSQDLYGRLVGSKSTTLHNSSDAQQQADDYIRSRAFARVYPNALTIPLHSPTVSDATRDTMCAIYNGVNIKTVDLPAVMGTEFNGFVEGWTWNLTRYTADLTLFCSAYSETYSSEIWYQVLPTITWATYNPVIEWEDA
jgi:hypothetical protein